MFCLLQPYCQKLLKCITKIKLKYVCATIGLIILLDVFGAFTHIFEKSYDDEFLYPYYGDIQPYVEALRHNKKPDVDPINEYNYNFIHEQKDKCDDENYKILRIVFLVKSAAEHFDRRQGIRNSWGFGKRFFDVPTRTIFLLGTHENDLKLQEKINVEAKENNDIVQANFIDSYYNNTIKTMIGFKWAVNNCKNSKFYMFVDDDIYISVKNVLRFIRNPTYYPDYLKEPSRMAAKREIKKSDYDLIEDKEILLTKNFEKFSAQINENLSNLQEPNESLKNFTAVEKNENSTNLQKINENVKKISFESKNKNLSNLQKTEENFATASSKKIFKRATAKEKIMMRRRPGWKFHNKTKMPRYPSKENYENLSFDSKKSLSKTSELSENLSSTKKMFRGRRQILDVELPDDVRLFAGYVFISSPHRHKTSKWYVSLNEYPYNLWPPYVTAGAYILSKEALIDMYYASLYTKHFKFDDIFLGLVAKKIDIEPFHCDEFHFYKKDYNKFNYKYVITSHGYDDPNELVQVWQEQKSLGNA